MAKLCRPIPKTTCVTNYITFYFLLIQEKAGTGFDDYGGTLELYNVIPHDNTSSGTSNNNAKLLSKIATSTRFGSLAWGKGGLLAGGMLDGTIQLWNSDKLIENGEGDAVEVRLEDGVVSAVRFCPFEDGGSGGGSLLARLVFVATAVA